MLENFSGAIFPEADIEKFFWQCKTSLNIFLHWEILADFYDLDIWHGETHGFDMFVKAQLN